MLVAGVDAGGSKTRCVIFDTDKQDIIAMADSGPGNYQVVGLAKACQEIEKAINMALDKIEADYLPLLGLGIAGAGRKKDREKLTNKLLSNLKVDDFYITDDAQTALLGATGGEPGLIIIAGTGSIGYGFKMDQTTIRSGGWGPFLGDEGSGFWLGLKALQAVIRADEKRGPETELRDIIKNNLKIKSLNELIPFIYQGELPRKEIAGLAPSIIIAAQKGDEVAESIIDKGINGLVKLVSSLNIRLDYNENRVAVAGGLFESEFYENRFSDKLTKELDFCIYRPKYSPALGAVFYAHIMKKKEGENG